MFSCGYLHGKQGLYFFYNICINCIVFSKWFLLYMYVYIFFNRQINHPKIENRFYSCTYIILTEHEIDFQNLNVVLKTVTIHVFNPQIIPTEHRKLNAQQ